MRGATILKASDDKTRALNPHTLMAFSGEAGDTVQFAEYIQANVQLYSMRNSMELSPAATANFVRGELVGPGPPRDHVPVGRADGRPVALPPSARAAGPSPGDRLARGSGDVEPFR